MHSYESTSSPGEIPHVRFAYEILDEEGGLSRLLMRALSARPRRFSELELLHGAPGTPELTNTLSRLERDGLVDKQTSRRHVAVFHTFELTAMGARAEAEMQRLRPLREPAEAPARRKVVNRRGTSHPGWFLRPGGRE